MTWTYIPGGSDPKDVIRLYIGDTDTTDQQLQDEEITAIVTAEGSPLRAAVTCCESIAARYTRKVTTAITGEISKAYSEMAKQYLALARTLRRRMARSGAIVPYAGGLSIADKQQLAANTDAVQPYFTRDMETEPGTETDDTDPFPPVPVPW